jgi:catechol 2,3-dioxygenase-like lactoylglutathione lyase family enzyme
MPEGPTLSAIVLFVRDIDRSAEFYSELFGLHEVLREPEAMLLAGDGGGPRLYLRGIASAGRRSASIGIQYGIWALESEDHLERAELWLRERDALGWKQQFHGVTVVEGRDPDRLAVVVHFPSLTGYPDEIFSRIYNY